MSYDLSAKELKAAVGSEPATRLDYFVNKVRGTTEIWTLAQGEALLVLGSEDHQEFVVVWPHPDYALGWFEDSGIEEADLVAMNLDDWIDGTLQELSESRIAINVFPTADQDGLTVDAKDLLRMFEQPETH